MPTATRFAPSPTGRLHLGHALSACVAYDLARASGNGHFLLRIEDIDSSRVRPEYDAGIIEDLQWLGLHWDGTILRQSERHAAYQQAFERLRAMNLVYPCFCTRRAIHAEFASMGGAPHGPEGPTYPGTCKRMGCEERNERMDSGEAHAWRLDSQAISNLVGTLSFEDQRHGCIEVSPELLGDVVIMRKDIGVAYHLAVIIDDAHQQINLISRGEDLLASTHVHRLLQAALKLPEPLYHHHALLLDEEGKRLAKRMDSLSIRQLRDSGREPEELLNQIRSFASL